MLMAQVDDAEPVALGILQHDEVRILRVAVPVDPPGTERHEPGRFGLLLTGIGGMQVQVQARVILRWRLQLSAALVRLLGLHDPFWSPWLPSAICRVNPLVRGVPTGAREPDACGEGRRSY